MTDTFNNFRDEIDANITEEKSEYFFGYSGDLGTRFYLHETEIMKELACECHQLMRENVLNQIDGLGGFVKMVHLPDSDEFKRRIILRVAYAINRSCDAVTRLIGRALDEHQQRLDEQHKNLDIDFN